MDAGGRPQAGPQEMSSGDGTEAAGPRGVVLWTLAHPFGESQGCLRPGMAWWAQDRHPHRSQRPALGLGQGPQGLQDRGLDWKPKTYSCRLSVSPTGSWVGAPGAPPAPWGQPPRSPSRAPEPALHSLGRAAAPGWGSPSSRSVCQAGRCWAAAWGHRPLLRGSPSPPGSQAGPQRLRDRGLGPSPPQASRPAP